MIEKVTRLKEFKKQWTFEGICVADSALYTAGRPNKLTKPNQVKYQVKGQIGTLEKVIEAETIKVGRFILATNILVNINF